ncbi:MAG TPA: FAD-binding oxidoreductase [Candidatus Limnocylindrales bacterium]|nr:FAD-binding oxidoreductase [Candidatus Limnocylindrales bacterium]
MASRGAIETALADFERRPYWWASMPALPDRRATELPAKADVVVVGGGYTGLAAARALTKAGRSVAVLEAERLGWGASARNGGIVHPGYQFGPRELGRRYGLGRGHELWSDALEAYAHLRDLIAAEAIDCDWDERGHLELAWSKGHATGLEEHVEELREGGVEARWVPKGELRAEIGTDFYAGAAAIEGSAGVHPGKLFVAIARLAERDGAGLHEGARVRRLDVRGPRLVRVETERGTIEAGAVVVATNGYTDGAVPFLRRRILPIGSYIVATEPLSAELAASIAPTGRVFFDSKHFLYYWRLTADRRLVFGGRISFLPTNTTRTSRALVKGMLAVHPQLEGVRVEYAWGGKVGFTFDRMPHAGRRPPIWYALGYCGTGVCLSTYLGMRVGEWLAGTRDAPALANLSFPLVPAPYEGRPWFLPFVGEWYRMRDRVDRLRG